MASNGQVNPAVEGRHCWKDYQDWCKAQGEQIVPLGRNNFHESLGMQPGVTRTGDKNHNWFLGFILRETPLD